MSDIKPEDRASLLQDRIHEDTGAVRAGRTVRTKPDDDEGGTCNVCGGGVRYGERHVTCGRAMMKLEAERDALRAAFDAACAFIDSHVADPDITAEMAAKYATFLDHRELLGEAT